jgi:carboxyl-terminal processing protease
MLPIANRGAGMFIAAPDVCTTPPGVPIPYVNVALNAMASIFSPNVFTAMMPSLTVGSVIPLTQGDEPGTLHWTFKGPAVVTTSFARVFFNFRPAATLTSLTAGNRFNAPLGTIAVPSITNVFAMLRKDEEEDEAAEAAPLAQAALLAQAAPVADALSLARALSAGAEVRGSILAGGVGYLEIGLFSIDVPARAHAAIRGLVAQGMRALVIDLRDNPGGDVAAALELAGDFLPPGALLCELIDEDGDELDRRARPGDPHRFPLFARVNRGTASASELFAGCLSAHGRAKLVGERTFGKGAGRVLLPSAGGLRGAAAGARLPDGKRIGAEGLSPDIAFPDDADAEALGRLISASLG